MALNDRLALSYHSHNVNHSDEVLTRESRLQKSAAGFGITITDGCEVTAVTPGGVAAQAGVLPGFVILAVRRRSTIARDSCDTRFTQVPKRIEWQSINRED